MIPSKVLITPLKRVEIIIQGVYWFLPKYLTPHEESGDNTLMVSDDSLPNYYCHHKNGKEYHYMMSNDFLPNTNHTGDTIGYQL